LGLTELENKLNKAELLKRKIPQIKLNALLEITKLINNNATVDKLFESYLIILIEELNMGKVALYVNDDGWYCAARHGLPDEYSNIKVEEDLLKITEITEINFISTGSEKAFDIVIPVYHKLQPLAFLLIGDIDENKVEISPIIKHLPFIQTFTNIIVVAIENKKLAKEYMRQLSANKELELASKMQTLLFPRELPNDNFLEVSAYYQPHLQVGGDYYDYIKLNENEYALCVADVSGKGVSAALLMANFQANLRAMFRYNNTLTDIIIDLNNIVFSNAHGEKFITLFLAKYNVVTRVLNYVNAGHNPPLLFTNGTVLPLTTGCVGLGMFQEIERIKEGLVFVSNNSLLVCYTDGLVEQYNNNKEEYGVDNIRKVVNKNFKSDVTSINAQIMLSLDKFKESNGYIDDIALLTTKFK
jgi:sigma-B regulation protein RsbU (phosphoserine phosphatase)